MIFFLQCRPLCFDIKITSSFCSINDQMTRSTSSLTTHLTEELDCCVIWFGLELFGRVIWFGLELLGRVIWLEIGVKHSVSFDSRSIRVIWFICSCSLVTRKLFTESCHYDTFIFFSDCKTHKKPWIVPKTHLMVL